MNKKEVADIERRVGNLELEYEAERKRLFNTIQDILDKAKEYFKKVPGLAETEMLGSLEKCPVCNGEGKRFIQTFSIYGHPEQPSYNSYIECTACNGLGYFRKVDNMEELVKRIEDLEARLFRAEGAVKEEF